MICGTWLHVCASADLRRATGATRCTACSRSGGWRVRFAANDRGMLDLLSISDDGRLAVIELKAAEDPQLALQGLDYWIRVRWHHMQNPDQTTGLGEFQRHGYFGGIAVSDLAPRLILVAPALRVHPATEIVLRHLSPGVEWTLVAIDERWRDGVKVVWRKRSSDRV